MIYSLEALVDKALICEKQFTKNKYHGDPNAGLFKYQSGELPVIISAPHAVKQIRDNKLKKADIFTGSLAIILQELTGCHLIYRSYTAKGDANRDIQCPYKKFLLDKISQGNIYYLIDLHGMDEHRDFDIDIGTLNGKSVSWSLKTLILNSFKGYEINDIKFDFLFNADKKGTVTQTVWQQQAIYSFQVEINGRYRNLKRSGNHEGFYRLVCSLENLILSLSKDRL